MQWAKDHAHWTERQWNSIIWSDESRFEVSFGDTSHRVIRFKSESLESSCLNRKIKFAPSVMVWGCMSAQGLGSLHIVDGNMNAEKYQKVLADHLLPSIPNLSTEYGEFIYQQDGATCHTARSSMKFLLDNEVPVLPWPSSSPDLSPIETLWGKIKNHLRKNPCATKPALVESLKSVWASITDEYCHNLVSTMARRCNDVILKKGDVTNW